MDKLKMHSVNKVDENIAKIGALFPNCLTERKNEDGEVELAIDFDMLKQELSSVVYPFGHFRHWYEGLYDYLPALLCLYLPYLKQYT